MNKIKIESVVKDLINKSSGIKEDDLDMNESFFDMGYSSIDLPIVSQGLAEILKVDIPVEWFFENNMNATPQSLVDDIYNTLKTVGTSETERETEREIEEKVDIAEVLYQQVQPKYGEPVNYKINNEQAKDSDIDQIILKQIELMSAQLQFLSGKQSTLSSGVYNVVEKEPVVVKPSMEERKEETKVPEETVEKVKLIPRALQSDEAFGPYQKIVTTKSLQMNSKKEVFFEDFIKRYIEKTKMSREHTQEYRYQLANNRHVAGFKPEYKNILYPIIAKDAKGAKLWDIDGNEYVDIAMGFGVYLLGHKPDFVIEPAKEALLHGAPLGPMSYLPGRVAELLCDMAHVDRAAFYNSGTEAVMVALRLARAATKRYKIVIFAGSYHGTFDGVLARDNKLSAVKASMPAAPGIPQHMIDNVIVLDYGKEESLKVIEENGSELAAVIVETVQSRNMGLQPKEFLHKLREITTKSKTVLIFDEVITGFRAAQGGAQEVFGIKADLVTYGKIVGGGLPIGVVAGKEEFMDGIDGGIWNFDDNSMPKFDDRRIFVAGTFCHHPVTMAASYATLSYLKEQGSELQQNLNRRTQNMVNELNAIFQENNVPILVDNFASEFRFNIPPELEIFFYLLILKGVHVWEGRSCFLSTAHTEDDVKFIIKAVKEAVKELIDGGFVAPKDEKKNDSLMN